MYSPMFSPNHFNICEMKGVLAQRIGGDSPHHLKTIPKDQLIRKITLYREILKVYQTIAPGTLLSYFYPENSENIANFNQNFNFF